ncbi:MAG TPA: SOS response-associated peptidase [Nitrospirales bacterium]|nr:SOS response-associated peptidase [Nitrospirales bacterium]HIO22633.1 SOS response-associated peptidase [Nitrospirales bacterium]
MCGRYTLTTSSHLIETLFSVESTQELKPRYNIAPTQQIPLVRIAAGGVKELVELRWGLIPGWSRERKADHGIINARAETVRIKPSFRGPFRSRRCLVPADGYYEWQSTDGGKQPHYIRMKDGAPFALAGLWDLWVGKGGSTAIESCTIITTVPNQMLSPIHARMPVIIGPENYGQWLDHETSDVESLQILLRPFLEDAMEAYPVSQVVNNPRNDTEECLVPLS